VKKFLPVYDTLLRAIKMMAEDDSARKGMEMTLNQFETVLTSLGVTPIEALGKEFDPELHNAVMHVEDDDAGENIIVEEFEKGFKLGDKVIRFSIVKVAN
jgi:molecular chaperone GrpE